jgi:hypothetical protein
MMKADLPLLVSIAAFCSSLAAGLTAWGTLRAVKEMRRQREASYRPDIAYSVLVLSGSEQHPGIQICNIGLGVAKNVAVNISVQLEEFLPSFNEAFRDDDLSISSGDGALILEVVQDDGAIVSRTFPLACSARIQYLFPGKDSAVDAAVPACLGEMFRLVTFRAFEKKDERCKELLRMIKLKLSAGFFDVGGKRYSSEYVYTLFDALFDHETK